MSELISVIVPVYKVEAYLDKCVHSIVDQTYRGLDIILVDDGSPDNCPAMCDAWAERDGRIRVIHKENGGLSDARNAGMAVATGNYIGFVDSDDYIAPTMYARLMQKLTETDSDISACGVTMMWDDGSTKMLTAPGETVLDNAAAMEAIVRETWLKQPVVYKLYRRETVDGILFEKGKCHEDVFWSYQPIARAKRVCVFDEPLYFYRQRTDSIMGEQFSVKRLDALEAKEKMLEFLKKNYPSLVDVAQNDLYFYCVYLMQTALRAKADVSIKKTIRDCAKKYPAVPHTVKECVWAMLSKLSFDGICRVRNRFKIGI